MVKPGVGERYTFSSLINCILELEGRVAEFYRDTARRAESRELGLLLSSLSESHLRNAELISGMRKTIVEMALEPISGLNLNSYITQVNSIITSGDMDDLDRAIQLSKVMGELYSSTSSRIASISPDTSELLSRLSRGENIGRRKLEEFKTVKYLKH